MVKIYVYGQEEYPLEKLIKQIDNFSVMYYTSPSSKIHHGFVCHKLTDGWYIELENKNAKTIKVYDDTETLKRLKKFCEESLKKCSEYPPLIIFNPPKDFDTNNLMLKGTKTAVWGKKSHRDDLASALTNNFRKML